MRKLLVYMKDYKKESFLAPLFKLLEATFELIVPLVIAQIIDVGIQTGDTGFIISRCLLLVGFGVVGMISAITAQYFAAKAAVGFAVNGKGYITTGSVKDGSSSYCVADTWEYDPATDTWTRKDDFKGGVRDGALAFSIGGYAMSVRAATATLPAARVPTRWTFTVSIPMEPKVRNGKR